MNNIWSEHIQGINMLYLSRKLRFDDFFKDRYLRFFDLDKESDIKILEIGCGPGALVEALHRWYPKAQIYGIDLDSNFISFAKHNIPGVEFIEGDVTKLPFPDDSFDVVISNTLQEHIEPSAFWGEQKRVLKPGGICICLSARRGIENTAPCLKMTEEEKRFWESIPDRQDLMDKYNVGKYKATEAELPKLMSGYGFFDITTAYIVIDLTPDDPKYPKALSEAMIEALRQNDIEAIKQQKSPDETEMLNLINQKYDKRMEQYRQGIAQWDTSVSVTMMVRGRA